VIWFWVERAKVKVSVNSNRAWVRTLSVPSSYWLELLLLLLLLLFVFKEAKDSMVTNVLKWLPKIGYVIKRTWKEIVAGI